MNDSIEDVINRECEWYNWGGNVEKGYSTYPKEYGARCEYFKEFFDRSRDNILTPSCYKCEYSIEW